MSLALQTISRTLTTTRYAYHAGTLGLQRVTIRQTHLNLNALIVANKNLSAVTLTQRENNY